MTERNTAPSVPSDADALMAKERDRRSSGLTAREHGRVADDVRQAEGDEREEPHDHDRTEHGADAAGAATLHQKQTDQDRRP